jgi:HAD superfamily hydrolase (TIGR01450 family)
LLGCDRPLAARYDLALLDLDGVVYIGPAAVPGAVRALQAAGVAGMRLGYVTNNASRPPQAVAAHLQELGVPAGAGDVITSAQVASALLARRLPAGAAVLVVGGQGLVEALAEVGLRAVGSVDEGAQAVVQGFSPEVGWRLLAEGARAVRAGLPWVATNLDPTVPTVHGPAPGNGTLVQVIATATGHVPDAVAGKPAAEPFLEAVRRFRGRRALVVGDRLDTDLEGARAAGLDGLMVLSGVHGALDLLACPPHRRPDYVGADLAALLEEHPPASVDASGVGVCRAARVQGRDGTLSVLDAGPDALDLLRAASVAGWQALDAGGRPVQAEPVLVALDGLGAARAWAR